MGAEAGAQPGSRRAAHPYHMHDAIWQQPERVGRLLETQRALIERAAAAAATRRRLILAGIGTSYHAAQVGEHFLRHLTRGRATALVEQSFELVHYPLALGPDDAVIAISHRGWRNYSVQAVESARAAGALTIVVTGRDAGEGIRAADFVLTTCEQEISFAHTKSYTTALAALATFAIRLAERQGLLGDVAARAALARIPEAMRAALGSEEFAREAARQIAARPRWVFIGTGPNWATAREGALKAKETCHIAAEGLETEQFLHGPLVEMDSRAALVALLTGGPGDDRARGALRAAGELGVLRVAVAAAGLAEPPAELHLEVPATEEWLSPFVHAIPLQFLSYYAALEHGGNPDTGREDEPAHARARRHFRL